MKLTFNVKGAERRKLVDAICQITSTPVKYLGAPTFAYEIGNDYHVDKNGTVTGPRDPDIVTALFKAGFDAETAEIEAEVETPKKKGIMDIIVDELNANAEDGESWQRLHRTPRMECGDGRWRNLDGTFANTDPDGYDGEAAPDGATPTIIETTTEGDLLTIEFPIEDFTPDKMDNLANMVTAKAPLLRKALGIDDLVISTTDNALQFPWFRSLEPEAVSAYMVFIERLCKTALEKKRVTAKERPVENEKFSMRVWLISLGMVGSEFKAVRRELMKNLSGNSAFLRGAPPKAKEREGGNHE